MLDKERQQERFRLLRVANLHISRAVQALEFADMWAIAEELEDWLYEGEGRVIVDEQERNEDALEGDV